MKNYELRMSNGVIGQGKIERTTRFLATSTLDADRKASRIAREFETEHGYSRGACDGAGAVYGEGQTWLVGDLCEAGGWIPGIHTMLTDYVVPAPEVTNP